MRRILREAVVDLNDRGLTSSAGLLTEWKNRADLSSAFDLDVLLGTVANLRAHDTGSMLVDGVNGYASTPDNPSLELTGDVQTWTFYGVAPSDTTPESSQVLAGQWTNVQRGWIILLDDTPISGGIQINLSVNGFQTYRGVSSTAAVPYADGVPFDLQLVYNHTEEFMYFYTAPEGGIFVQLGEPVAVPDITLFNSTADLIVGATGDGTGFLDGSVKRFTLHDDDRLAASFNAADGGNKNGLASDTFETVIPDSEQVINNGLDGGFSSGVNWGANSNGTVSVVGNTLRVTQTEQVGSVTYTLTYGSNYDLVDGVRYRCRLKRPAGDPGTINLRYIDNSPNIATNLSAGVEHIIDFVKSDTSTGLELAKAGSQDDYFSLEYFSIEEINQFTLHGNAFIQNLGHTVANSFGSAGIETTAGQTLSTDLTVFMVAKAHELTASNQFFTGARSLSGSALVLYADNAGNFEINAGVNATVGSSDTDWHLWALRYNRDATSSLYISDVGTVTADFGAEDWEALTLFANNAGANTLNGAIADLTVIPRALTDTEYDQIKNDLINFYGIAA